MLSDVHCVIKCTINGQVTIDNKHVREEPSCCSRCTQYHKRSSRSVWKGTMNTQFVENLNVDKVNEILQVLDTPEEVDESI